MLQIWSFWRQIGFSDPQKYFSRLILNKFSHKFSGLNQNKTKYTMDTGIYYLLEADEDNTNRY